MKANSIRYTDQEFRYKVQCVPSGAPTRSIKRSRRSHAGGRRLRSASFSSSGTRRRRCPR
jgi:hypothetical protein